jgi:hypothetical protein
VLYLDYEDPYIADEPRKCSEYWRCFFITFDWTFKFTGSIGNRLRDSYTIERMGLLPEGYQTMGRDEVITAVTDEYQGVDLSFVSHYYTRFFFDNAVNIILVFILLNMVQGIIIDTFGSLKEKLKERIDDQTFTCFICGIDRQKLDKSSDESKGFFYHIKVAVYLSLVSKNTTCGTISSTRPTSSSSTRSTTMETKHSLLAR